MRAAKPFYLAVLGLTLSGCSALSQSPAPVVQGGQTRPATAYPDAYTPPPAPMASGSRGAVTVQAAPAGEVSVYRAKAPVKVSPASSTSTTTTASSTHIPAYPMNSSQAAPAPTPVPMGSRAPSSRDPDDDRPDSYKVKAGDTLYSIALNYGQDYRDIAAWNQLDDPGVIKVDQVLRLTPPAEPAPARSVAVAPAAAPAAEKPAPTPPVADAGARHGPKAVKLPYSAEAVRKIGSVAEAAPADKSADKSEARSDSKTEKQAKADKPASKTEKDNKVDSKAVDKDKLGKDKERDSSKNTEAPRAPTVAEPAASAQAGEEDVASWGWPTQGKVINRFTDNNKGIDIGGKAGQPVLASAKGRVVYSGSGLRGYGKLIIIKHNKTFLTAYAHNSQLLVKEGQVVTKGQKIAEMGNSDADQVKLHFEIRRFGKPVDPQKYLGNAP